MKLRYTAAAGHELLAAVEFYEGQETGLGEAFQAEVARIESILLRHPRYGRRVRGGRRSVLLWRFPYRLVYSIDQAGIRILVLAHQKQRPDAWWARVDEPPSSYATAVG